MGFFDRFRRKKKPSVPQTGTVFLKPSEKASAGTPPKGITYSVPETGETKTSTSSGYTKTSGGASSPMDVITSGKVSRGGGGGSSGGGGGSPTSFQPSFVVDEEIQQSLREPTPEPKPSPVAFAPTDDVRDFKTRSFGGAVTESGRRFFSRFGSPTSSRSDLGEILTPFDETKEPGFAEEGFVSKETGKFVSTKRLTERQKDFLKESGADITTKGEVQVERDVLSTGKVTQARTEAETFLGTQQSQIQASIDTGLISVPEGQKQLDEIIATTNLEFQEEQQQIFKDIPDVPGVRQGGRSGVRDIVDIAVLSNPLTSFIGAAVSSKQDPLIIDTSQFDEGVSIEGATTSRPSLRTGTFIAGGVIGGAGKLKAAGRGATEVRAEVIAETLAKQTKGVQFKQGEIVSDISFSSAKTEGAIGFAETRAVSKGGKVAGRQDSLIVVKEFFSNKPVLFSETKAFAGKSASIPVGEKGFFSLGEIVSAPSRRVTAFETKKGVQTQVQLFTKPTNVQKEISSSLSFKRGDLVLSASGKPTFKKDVFFGDTGIKAVGKPTLVSFDAESIGLTKVLQPKTPPGITSFKGGRGARTSLEKTFTNQIVAPKISFKLPKPKTSISPSTGGGAIFQQGNIVGKQGIVDTKTISPRLKLTKVRVKSGAKIKPAVDVALASSLGLSNIQRQKSFQKAFQEIIPASKLKEKQIQVPVQREKLKQKLVEEQIVGSITTPPPRVSSGLGQGYRPFFFIPPFKLPKGGGGGKGDILTSTLLGGKAPTFTRAKIVEEFGGRIKKGKLPFQDLVGTPGQILAEVKRRKVKR